jgi:hypothetical protein
MLLLFVTAASWGQRLSSTSSSTGLPLEEAIEVFFTTFRDDHTPFGVYGYAESIAIDYGMAVMPYLKERLKDADFFHSYTEPKDITLSLISYIIRALNIYSDPVFNDLVEPYTVPDEEIQWFVDEYKRRIDEYIMVMKVIDATVLYSEVIINALVDTKYTVDKYGHPYSDKLIPDRGNDLKEYYEKRLGISDLVVLPAFIE